MNFYEKTTSKKKKKFWFLLSNPELNVMRVNNPQSRAKIGFFAFWLPTSVKMATHKNRPIFMAFEEKT